MHRRVQPRRPSARVPRVSIVVPCYNYGHFLPDCVNSLITQPDVEVDVLIIDDASPDGSGEVAMALAAQHGQVRVIRHSQNMGHIATYNEGLALVEGDYAVLLSADDLLTPGSLGRATSLMERFPQVGLTYGNPRAFDTTPPSAATKTHSWSVWSGRRWIDLQFKRNMSIIYSPEAVVRTSVQHAVGDYRPELPHSGDLEMWLRIAAIADVGRVNGPDQAFRREHAASMMHTHYGTVIKDLRAREEAYESFLRGPGAALPNAEDLRQLARRRMAQEAIDWANTLTIQLPSAGESRQVLHAELAECLAFAAGVFPNYRSLLAWREHQTRSSASAGVATSCALRAHAVRRDLKGRVRWQRWHRFGV